MAREIDEAWIEEAIERYRRIESLQAEFDQAVPTRRGDRPLARRAGRGGGHRRPARSPTSGSSGRCTAAASATSPARCRPRSPRPPTPPVGAGEAARRDVRRLPAAGGGLRWTTLRALAARLDEASATLDRRLARVTATRPGRTAAFGADAPGRLGEIGRALHRQWTAATDDRAREARAAAGSTGRRRGRRARRRRPATPRSTGRPAAGSPGSRDGRARPARRAGPSTCSRRVDTLLAAGAPERAPGLAAAAPARGRCPARRSRHSPRCARRRWPPPAPTCAGYAGAYDDASADAARRPALGRAGGRRRTRRTGRRCAPGADDGPGGWSRRRPGTPTAADWVDGRRLAWPGAGRRARLGRGGRRGAGGAERPAAAADIAARVLARGRSR